jgi:two-component system sensor histidine kinase BarA
MSYRLVIRLLGETSLERKCRFLFGGYLLVLITGSFWWYGSRTEDQVYAQNRRRGEGIVDAIMIQYHAEKLEGNIKFRDEIWEGLSKSLQRQKYEWDFIRPNSDSGRAQDAKEFEVLAKFSVPPPPPKEDEPVETEYEERADFESDEYFYYQPIRWNNEHCYHCHTTIGAPDPIGLVSVPPQDGDLMAVVRVKIPLRDAKTQKDLNVNFALLVTTAIVTVALAMVALYILVRYVIVKPLKHLRDVANAISHGDLRQRADIHTGDEFEQLGAAFNRMLRHLVDAQDELRNVNADLDGKVDELAQVNMRLYEMNRLKSDFLATISHELRTPLNSILGFSDVLAGIDSLDEKQSRYVTNIRTSGKMLLDMINDILDLAKLESGKMDVRLTDFRIEQVISAQCDMARPLTESKNIDLEIEIEPGLPEMHQDQAKAQQVLSNLLSNAIKFTPEGGRIVISARRNEHDELQLRVADTGVGIAEEDQVTIFEKFRQGKAGLSGGDTMTREYSGTGLGLSIVKELCKLLGGSISVESQLGNGSTFSVRLPWKCQQQPKLDSPFTDTLDKMTRPQLRQHGTASDDTPAIESVLPAESGS